MEDERRGLPIPWPEGAPYTASYCEENIYLLLARCMAITHGEIYVVFVSNPNKTVSTHHGHPYRPFDCPLRVRSGGPIRFQNCPGPY
jgi:hypothetical protein